MSNQDTNTPYIPLKERVESIIDEVAEKLAKALASKTLEATPQAPSYEAQPEEDIYDAVAARRKAEAEEAAAYNFKADHFGCGFTATPPGDTLSAEARILALCHDQKELQRRVVDRNARIYELEQELENSGREMQAKLKEFKEDARQKLNAACWERDSHDTARREAERREKETRGKLIKARKECERLRQWVGKLEAKSAVAVERLEREEAGIDALGMNIVELQREAKARAARIEELEKDAERYKARIKEVTGWCDELYAKSQNLEAGVKKAFEEGREATIRRAQEAEKRVDELEGKLADKAADCQGLKNLLEDSEKRAEELGRQCARLEGFLTELDAAMTDLENATGYARESTFLRDRIVDLIEWEKENHGHRARARILDLEATASHYREQLEKAEDAIARFEHAADPGSYDSRPVWQRIDNARRLYSEVKKRLCEAEKKPGFNPDGFKALEDAVTELEAEAGAPRQDGASLRTRILDLKHGFREAVKRRDQGYAALNRDLQHAHKAIDHAHKAIEERNERLQLETERLRHEKASRKEAEATLNRCLAKAEEEERIHLANVAAWQELMDDTEAKLNRTRAKAKKWKGRAKDRKAIIADLEDRLSDYSNRLDDVYQLRAKDEEETRALREALQKIKGA